MFSCFKEVTILEELEGTDNCNKWYKISYNKRGKNYTGYSCGTYISKKNVDSSTLNIICTNIGTNAITVKNVAPINVVLFNIFLI